MKTITARKGPFAQRPFYRIREIEQMCTASLHATNLLPTSPEPIRIDRFIEKRFGVEIEYQALPAGVLGYTEFGSRGVKSVVVSEAFGEADISRPSERRLRTTLAHEGGHGLLHAHLFALGEPVQSLFGHDHAKPEILCRDVDGIGSGGRGYNDRWWEFQANKAIGALLLPRPLVRTAVASYLTPVGLLGDLDLPTAAREAAIRLVAEAFDVNPVVARLRLDDIFGSATSASQLHL